MKKQPMKMNTVILCCTFFIVAALMWNVQVARYHVTEGLIFDSLTLSFYDAQSKTWVSLEK